MDVSGMLVIAIRGSVQFFLIQIGVSQDSILISQIFHRGRVDSKFAISYTRNLIDLMLATASVHSASALILQYFVELGYIN